MSDLTYFGILAIFALILICISVFVKSTEIKRTIFQSALGAMVALVLFLHFVG